MRQHSRSTVPVGLLFAAVFWFHLPVHAADIARDVREGRNDETVEQGGYLEFSLGVAYDGLPVVGTADSVELSHIAIGGHYRYQRFFIDGLSESYNELQFGLNLYTGPRWSVDLLAAVSERGVDSNLSDELDHLDDRPGGLNGGLRATTYSGPWIAQAELLQDTLGLHDGQTVTGVLGRQWLVRNWNLHALAGFRYQSAGVLDYLFGVDEDEATERFPAYEVDAGTTYVAELGVTYPLNEYLVFRGTVRWWELPDSVAESPFIDDERYQSVLAAFVLVY